MSFEDYPVSFSLEVNIEKAYENIRKYQTALYRTLDIMRQLGLPSNVDAAMSKLQQIISLANTARLTLHQLQIAQAGTPGVGWVLAAIGLISTLSTAGSMIEDAGWTFHRHNMSW